MITEDYVSFETAKLLKEKGFVEDIDLWYDENGEMFSHYKYDISCDWRVKTQLKVYLCPTLQMAMKWLREEHQIGIFPRQYHIYKNNAVYDEFGYGVEIIKLGTDIPLNPSKGNMSDKDKYFISSSHEKTCDAAIKYCLENLI